MSTAIATPATSAVTAFAIPQAISTDTLLEKYAKNGERDADSIYCRVAAAVAQAEKPEQRDVWATRYLANMRAGAIGAGRIMSAAGTDIKATLINCFVQPVGDAIQGFDEDGLPGIYEALKEAAETMRRGGGVGYDFSHIRPSRALVNGTASMASGPCSYIDVYDKSCATVESAGARRGAQMGVLRITHPDQAEFITAKRTPGRWNNFNVSVSVTDDFMDALIKGEKIELFHKAKPCDDLIEEGAYQRADGMWVYRVADAKEIWESVMRSAYDFAEPGILFLSKINTDNNLWYCETIEATNPCGEQPLSNYACCDLGPIILPKFIRNPFGIEGEASFDYAGFAKAVATHVRFLDNVLDITYWPLEQQRKEAMSKRRIGVGFTGLGNALSMLKLRYNSTEGRAVAEMISECMRNAAYEASVELAKERGAFPLFDADKYLTPGTFASRLPADLQAKIRTYGIRNSHLLSIAPTGTVSLAFADNASNGIEPAFSWTYNRKKRQKDGTKKVYPVQDHAYRVYSELMGRLVDTAELPDYFVNALEMSADEHIAMMKTVQPYIDTSISKTVNVPVDMPYENFKDMYLQAWRAGLKGLSTYRPNDTLGSVLEVTPKAEAPAAAPAPKAVGPLIDPMRTVVDRRPEGALPAVAEKIVYWTNEGKKALYLVVSFMPVTDADGKVHERAIEFFMPIGQAGESGQWLSSSMRMLSLAARGGMLERALRDMRKVAWDRGPVRLGERVREEDGAVIPMWHDSEVAAIAYAIQEIIRNRAAQEQSASAPALSAPAPAAVTPEIAGQVMPGKKCDDCGAHAVIKKDGCSYCTNCGITGSCG